MCVVITLLKMIRLHQQTKFLPSDDIQGYALNHFMLVACIVDKCAYHVSDKYLSHHMQEIVEVLTCTGIAYLNTANMCRH